jgi:hypothetical protein
MAQRNLHSFHFWDKETLDWFKLFPSNLKIADSPNCIHFLAPLRYSSGWIGYVGHGPDTKFHIAPILMLNGSEMCEISLFVRVEGVSGEVGEDSNWFHRPTLIPVYRKFADHMLDRLECLATGSECIQIWVYVHRFIKPVYKTALNRRPSCRRSTTSFNCGHRRARVVTVRDVWGMRIVVSWGVRKHLMSWKSSSSCIQ